MPPPSGAIQPRGVFSPRLADCQGRFRSGADRAGIRRLPARLLVLRPTGHPDPIGSLAPPSRTIVDRPRAHCYSTAGAAGTPSRTTTWQLSGGAMLLPGTLLVEGRPRARPHRRPPAWWLMTARPPPSPINVSGNPRHRPARGIPPRAPGFFSNLALATRGGHPSGCEARSAMVPALAMGRHDAVIGGDGVIGWVSVRRRERGSRSPPGNTPIGRKPATPTTVST